VSEDRRAIYIKSIYCSDIVSIREDLGSWPINHWQHRAESKPLHHVSSVHGLLRREDGFGIPPLKITRNAAATYSKMSKMSKLSKIAEILQFDADTFAQQLTLIAATLYNRITTTECLTWPSLSKHSSTPTQTPHINAVIRHHKALRQWTLAAITTPTDRATQVQVITHFIAIAVACRALNDFASLFSVVSAIADDNDDERVTREVIQSLHAATKKRYEELKRLVGPERGFVELRRAMRGAGVPGVPCLGSLSIPPVVLRGCSELIGVRGVGFALTDLRFVEEGTRGESKDGVRNGLKGEKIARIVEGMRRWQGMEYELVARADVQRFIADSLGMEAS